MEARRNAIQLSGYTLGQTVPRPDREQAQDRLLCSVRHSDRCVNGVACSSAETTWTRLSVLRRFMMEQAYTCTRK